MALIAILISLVVERILGSLEELRRFDWFIAYLRWGAARMAPVAWLDGPLGLLLLLIPLIAPVVLIDYYLSGVWFLLALAFAVFILLACFGPRDLEAEVEAFVDARARGDDESAYWHAAELIGEQEVESSSGLTRRIMENIFIEANERLLAVIFWFVLLGPGGALLYRLSACIKCLPPDQENDLFEAGLRLNLLLHWLPARLCALAYALAGSFVDALHGWRQVDGHWLQNSHDILVAVGFGALHLEPGDLDEENTSCEQVSETMALVRRAVLVFLSIIALSTLAGWMG